MACFSLDFYTLFIVLFDASFLLEVSSNEKEEKNQLHVCEYQERSIPIVFMQMWFFFSLCVQLSWSPNYLENITAKIRKQDNDLSEVSYRNASPLAIIAVCYRYHGFNLVVPVHDGIPSSVVGM